ncbi:MAG: DMT family transporter, partial [Treponema sp.]|nr:DMT family transporter [Treponema sp.]
MKKEKKREYLAVCRASRVKPQKIADQAIFYPASCPSGPDGAKIHKYDRPLAMGALVLVTIVWGWGFVFSNMALEAGLRPAAIMVARFTLAALLVGVAFRKTIRANYRSGQWKSGLLVGGFLFLGFFIQILGLERSTPSNNAFITGAYVVMV